MRTELFWAVFLKMGPIDCPETSVRNYHHSLRNNPEQRSSPCTFLHCKMILSKCSIDVNGKSKTDDHKLWIRKYGVTECDGKMYYVLCSEFGVCVCVCVWTLQSQGTSKHLKRKC
jgi:hypothetical protein